MRIALTSVLVDDQAKALRFYTEVLGFVTKTDLPAGDYRWLTVVSPEGHDDVEMLLEPNQHPAAQAYQRAIYADSIPAASFASSDVEGDYRRMSALGVDFRTPPTQAGPVTIAVFDDTCGNLIQIFQG